MPLRVAGAQIDLVVGDLAGNEQKIAATMDWAETESADVLVLPELAVTGYPPEDLVLRPGFIDDNLEVVRRLTRRSGRCTVVVGFVDHAGPDPDDRSDAIDRRVANAVAIMGGGVLIGTYHKVLLPNYGVFDEGRYFAPGDHPAQLWEIGGYPVGVSICEDIWIPDGPPHQQALAGARLLLNANGSPFHKGKAADREAMLAARARATGLPVVYLNLVGGQDELVFDGASCVFSGDGTLLHRSPQFREHRFVVEVPMGPGEVAEPCCVEPLLDETAEVYAAITTGVRDYVQKNGFSQVVIGLSGGIDSALTATVAADALGPENVWGITMPSRFSSEGSVADSRRLADNLGIRFDLLPIDEVYRAYLGVLGPVFEGTSFGVAEENLQARVRGALLMAVSNKFGPMVLTTGNKSEMAAGYATLYGDMAGGYNALKDVFKGMVYQLARWRNRESEVIPVATIEKPPSAELRPGQKDSDSLPPYDILDAILARYIEADMIEPEIVADGFDEATVRRICALVDRNEYKRRQAAPGVKITAKAFGRDRRLPITNRYRG
jgi:NAD+ synthase (glutamine-hydrolysing)